MIIESCACICHFIFLHETAGNFTFYRSAHYKSVLIIIQQDATLCSLFILLQDHSTCFGCLQHPSSGLHENVTTASGTGHNVSAATSLQRG